MTTTHSARGLVWVDLSSPSDEEIAGLVQRYNLHPLVGEELKSSPATAKIDFYKDYILVVLTMPVRIKKAGGYAVVDREIDFVIGKSFLITSHSASVDQLEYFAKVFETNAILGKNEEIRHAGHIFYYMVMRLYAGFREDLENINDALITAEERIFKGEEHKMVETLSKLSRELIDFRQTARAHRVIWDDLIASDNKALFGQDFAPYAKELRDEFDLIHGSIDNVRELVNDLRETNDSLLNTKQNDIIRTLTIVAFIFYPATFIASLFTIPAAHVPIVSNENGWVLILGFMVLITAGIWWVIKKKRWI